MIPSAITISLVPQAQGGPFVFWDDLQASARRAAELGYDAVELFLPGPDAVSVTELRALLDETGLKVAAVGTGAGMVVYKLSLTADDAAQRQAAIQFVTGMIHFGGEFGAPAIIGSMQGRWTPASGKEATLDLLGVALRELAETSQTFGVPLIYEPLNRYETNLCNSLLDGVKFIESRALENVVLLADLFHMNIEEVDLATAFLNAGPHVGHLHFVDSNRRPAGYGHLDYAPIAAALRDIGYKGYASAEALPWPDSDLAAIKTMETYRKVFG
ncbi:sugar phosphate isomerase/epimerase family protein [Planctomicrobium piriforme]|uniref:Sugar phosphate isomerase/epimerase n=1 Tax=Planctomicrobium piriforme TaxID=1576369 RepID=A0A1I3RTB6_9PLAN|nr:sugar phosphate isomerase/epimerase family protein [Planctomicrobium piriforme]SFJ48571.1 Sugar phosphate isomerase/epimerase [Planctomicrobium piriforme]